MSGWRSCLDDKLPRPAIFTDYDSDFTRRVCWIAVKLPQTRASPQSSHSRRTGTHQGDRYLLRTGPFPADASAVPPVPPVLLVLSAASVPLLPALPPMLLPMVVPVVVPVVSLRWLTGRRRRPPLAPPRSPSASSSGCGGSSPECHWPGARTAPAPAAGTGPDPCTRR